MRNGLVSNCCGAYSYGESDLCGKCYEHADFECEGDHEPYHQPEEKENNVPESYTCEVCGIDLPMPEADWDSMRKEE